VASQAVKVCYDESDITWRLSNHAKAAGNVLWYLIISGNEGKVLHNRLGDEDSIEGILMNRRQSMHGGDVFGPQEDWCSSKLVEGIEPPVPWIAHAQIAFHTFEHHLPIGHNAQEVGAGEDSGAGSCLHRVGIGERNQRDISIEEIAHSQVAFEETVKIDRSVPARWQLYALLHAAQPDFSSLPGRRRKLGDRLAVARNHHGLPTLYHPEELRKPILSFDNTDIHCTPNIAIKDGHVNRLSLPPSIPHTFILAQILDLKRVPAHRANFGRSFDRKVRGRLSYSFAGTSPKSVLTGNAR
jgi:hypothetical protein